MKNYNSKRDTRKSEVPKKTNDPLTSPQKEEEKRRPRAGVQILIAFNNIPGGHKKEKEGKKKDPPGSYQRLDLFIKVLLSFWGL